MAYSQNDIIYSEETIPKWTPEYKLLTKKQIHIPNLSMIGYADFHTSSEKLMPHFHCNMEFVVVLSGKQQYFVNNKYFHLHGGDIFMTYPYENHGNNNLPQDICEFIWFQIDLSSSQNFLGLTSSYGDYLFRQLLNYTQRIRQFDPKDASVLKNAFYNLSSSQPQKQLFGYSCFLQFVTNNICTSDVVLTRETYSPSIQDSLSYIHAHLTDDLSLELIAKHCGLSPARFKVKFKEQLGITPHAYITALKIDTAKILLKNPQNTVTDVAFQLNFSSSNHFSSVFKKYTSFTPTDFRNQRMSNIY